MFMKARQAAALSFTVPICLLTTWAMPLALITPRQNGTPPDSRFHQVAKAGDSNRTSTIRVDVNEVLVPVIVTDEAGQPVFGLGRDDFKLYEDGVFQNISRVVGQQQTVSSNAGSSAPSSSIVIAFDALHTRTDSFERVCKSLRKSFETHRPSESLYEIISIGRYASVVLPPTRDIGSILKAVASPSFCQTAWDGASLDTAEDMRELRQFLETYCRKCDCSSRPNISCYEEKQLLRNRLNEAAARYASHNRDFLTAVEATLEVTAHLQGVPTLILISDGFSRFPGKELFDLVSVYLPTDPEWHLPPFNLTDEYTHVIEVARNKNIRINTIESRGLYSSPAVGGLFDASTVISPGLPGAPGSAIMLQENLQGTVTEDSDSLAHLADDTGGFALRNSNDLVKCFRTVMNQSNSAYLLVYRSSNGLPNNKFRRLAVKTKDKKLRVRAKSGYWPHK